MTKFTVIVPVYNVEGYIRKCLDSVLNQTFKDFEVICVDDCGKDNSVQIVEEYVAKDKRFKLLHHDHNMGLSAARNTALDVAKGEYIFFLDSDDWLELNALEVLYDKFEETGVDAIWFGFDNWVEDEKLERTDKVPANYYNINSKTIVPLVGYVWNKAYRASKINIRFPFGLLVEDMDFTFKFFCQLQGVLRIDDVLINYRKVREGSITTYDDKFCGRIIDEIKIVANMCNFAKEKGLLDRFKPYLLKVMGDEIRKLLCAPHNREAILKEAHAMFESVNFPQDFEPKLVSLWMDK